MDSEGEGLTMLNTPDESYRPSMSPDGRKIAMDVCTDDYSPDSTENWDVWVMDADGTNLTRITTDPAYDEFCFWVPMPETVEKQGKEENGMENKQ